MTGNIFSIKLLNSKYLLALFLLIFAACVLYLQSLKAPWVDECYSYYGVWHDSFSAFYDSMLTGINFSPHSIFCLIFAYNSFSQHQSNNLEYKVWFLLSSELCFLFCLLEIFLALSPPLLLQF